MRNQKYVDLNKLRKFFPSNMNPNLSWREICQYEKNVYDSNPSEGRDIEYSEHIRNESKKFVKMLSSLLSLNTKILDLGGSGDPWFSYLCADQGMNVYTYDFLEPIRPDVIKQKKITYIKDDINNLHKYTGELSNLDFIFCRALSPPQMLSNWYDKDFVKIWHQLLDMLNENGIIYWMQMTNGTGKRSTVPLYFSNHTAKYFNDFFKNLGLNCKITKYGYMTMKISKQLQHPWNQYFVSNTNSKPKDLYEIGDYGSLLKHYAFQLQSFYEQNDFEQNFTIEIKGNPICSKIVRILLLDNFGYANAIIVGDSNITTIKIVEKPNLPIFTLSNTGLEQGEFFLVDEQEDNRFTSEYMGILRKHMMN